MVPTWCCTGVVPGPKSGWVQVWCTTRSSCVGRPGSCGSRWQRTGWQGRHRGRGTSPWPTPARPYRIACPSAQGGVAGTQTWTINNSKIYIYIYISISRPWSRPWCCKHNCKLRYKGSTSSFCAEESPPWCPLLRRWRLLTSSPAVDTSQPHWEGKRIPNIQCFPGLLGMWDACNIFPWKIRYNVIIKFVMIFLPVRQAMPILLWRHPLSKDPFVTVFITAVKHTERARTKDPGVNNVMHWAPPTGSKQ